jgi:hypothetical protein
MSPLARPQNKYQLNTVRETLSDVACAQTPTTHLLAEAVKLIAALLAAHRISLQLVQHSMLATAGPGSTSSAEHKAALYRRYKYC